MPLVSLLGGCLFYVTDDIYIILSHNFVEFVVKCRLYSVQWRHKKFPASLCLSSAKTEIINI